MNNALSQSGKKTGIVDLARPRCLSLSAAVDKDQVQVRPVTQLNAAELAIAHHCKSGVFAPWHAMPRHQLCPRHINGLLDDDLSQESEVVTGLHNIQPTAQLTRGHSQNHPVLDRCHQLHLLLEIILGNTEQLLSHECGHLFPGRGAVEPLLMQQLLDQLRSLLELFGNPKTPRV